MGIRGFGCAAGIEVNLLQCLQIKPNQNKMILVFNISTVEHTNKFKQIW
jgi:hypothetical protein